MAKNRELSQLGSFVVVNDTNGNIGIATTATPSVGIGTTNPQAKLHVVSNAIIGELQITSAGIVTSLNPGISTIKYYGDGSNLIGVNAFNVISQDLATSPVYPTFASNVGVTSIGIASTQVAYIPSTNRFGIGTTNPQYTLEVVGNTRVSGLTSITNLEIYGTVSAASSVGSNGQYLKSTGVGVTWADFPTLRTVGINTATNGQTTFAFSYTVGFIDVFVNGVKLITGEYTASNGSSVILSSPAFENDIVELIGYNTISTSGSGGGGGASSLNDLTDVTLTLPAAGEALVYDGSQWVNDYTVTASTSSTSQTPIHTLSSSTYRSVEYTIQATQGTKYHLTKILVIHDGTLTYPTEYGTVYTNGSLGIFDLDISGGNIRLLVTPSAATTTNYKIKFTAFKN